MDHGQARATERRFAELYAEHHAAIHGYFLRRLASYADAADATAETFAVAWRRFDRVPDGAARPWLFGVARRVLANQRRGERRRSSLHARLGAGLAPAAEAGGETPGVLEALGRLSPGDRELLMLLAWDGLPPREIAKVLRVPASVVSVRLHRARRRLEAEMRPAGETQHARRLTPEETL